MHLYYIVYVFEGCAGVIFLCVRCLQPTSHCIVSTTRINLILFITTTTTSVYYFTVPNCTLLSIRRPLFAEQKVVLSMPQWLHSAGLVSTVGDIDEFIESSYWIWLG